MQRRPLFWLMVSLLCLGGTLYFWRQGERAWQGHKGVPPIAPAPAVAQPAAAKPQAAIPSIPVTVTTNAAVKTAKSRYPYRLSNTDKTSGQLQRSDKAIHLMNALIDTSKSVDLAIPDRLRAPKDNGSYVAQARGPLDDHFRAMLQAAGASIVSYIPNNAYLVRVSEAGAQRLEANPLTQSVMPFEPYYKLDPTLLKAVMEEKDLPTSALKVTLFPDASEEIFDSLKIHTIASESSPFGPVVTVPASKNTIVDIVRLPGVQAVAPAHERKIANDLSRVRLGAATNTLIVSPPYLNLTGSNVLININDSGVDATHPDLIGRITGSITDDNGHGTHVAGTILGSGAQSSTVTTNASGSVIPGADFRGVATNAHAYVISIGGRSDSFLQEQAAKTNALISNNSWNFGSSDYDIEAASYDAAVRDALPLVSGSQPLVYVFSAGNSGAGDDSGAGGDSESILSPATAKNVITVGAMEQPRNITNDVVKQGATNQPWIGETDSDNQIAAFSSRGNVGIGIEGDNGRFKPDVVAPGTFVISTRSTTWDTKAYYNPTNYHYNTHFFQTVETNSLAPFSVFVPDNAVQLIIEVFTNRYSPVPFPDMPIYLRQDDNPTLTTFDFKGTNIVSLPLNLPLVTGASIFYSIGNPTNQTINFDVQTTLVTTNDNGNYFEVLSNLNDSISADPHYYRYESGTSMSAAGVSGMLACMEEFFVQRLQITNPSPALMKALLINGARSVAQQYDLQVGNFINYQGWGLASLPNSIPGALTNTVKQTGDNSAAMRFFDQDPTNALATGQSKTYSVVMGSNSLTSPLRVTLVWTDPPGNPQAGTKLVNDLDLIVTNIDTGEVFYGNNIPSGSDFTSAWDTNGPPPLDSINNVENVYLSPTLGTNYSVTVFAHRVNVNAVTGNTNNVVQDYALVIASGDAGVITNGFTITTNTPVSFVLTGALTTLSNGIPLLNQRVGGNSQYSGSTNGMTNQWNFYAYTNTTAFPNVAFVTFLPPNLGVPRMGTREEDAPTNGVRLEADIDLYVSSNPAITNLDPLVLLAADKSLTRTGTEKVLYSNSVAGQVYYIAIKSEDQEGAQYGFVGVASALPFGQRDGDGNIILTPLTTLPQPIPDGSPALPGALTILALTTEQAQARRVLVTDNISHQNFGDLIGTLTHGQKFTVLNNHTFFDNGVGSTNETFTYDDSGEGDITGSRHVDGPGSLRDFVGDRPGDGIWILSMVDNALTQTGSVNSLEIKIEPQPQTNGVTKTIVGGGSFFEFVDVPVDCTNLTVSLIINSLDAAPLQLEIKRGSFPTLTSYDKGGVINPPGGAISISSFDSPPLNPGRYFIEVHNPNATSVTFTLTWTLSLSLTPGTPFQFLSAGNEPILDDAVTYSTNHVGIESRVVTAEVGVRIDHPRISDLVLTLISPQGTRVLLAENRGATTTNYGFGTNTILVQPPVTPTAGDANPNTNIITLPGGVTAGTLVVNYNFFTVPDTMHVYYNGVKIFDSGLVSLAGTFAVDFGPGASPGVIMIIMNEGGNSRTTAWQYSSEIVTKSTTYAIFTEDTNKTTTPIKFATPPFGAGPAFSAPVTNLTSSFEGLPEGDYNLVDGWATLNTNTVKVVAVPAFAATGASGTNILALHSGSITRTLPTIGGQSYTLTFVNHGRPEVNPVSWWPAELNFLDIAGGNNGSVAATNVSFAPGEVHLAFNFNGGRIAVGDPTNLHLQDFSIDAWVQRNSATQAATTPDGGHIIGYGTGGYCLGLIDDGTPFLTETDITGIFGSQKITGTNAYHHLGLTKSGSNLVFYVDGVPFQTGPYNPTFHFLSSGAGIGQRGDGVRGRFLGKIDELDVFSNILSDAQMQDIYAAGSAGKCLGGCSVTAQVTLGSLITNIAGNDTWATNSFTFTATSNNMILQIQPNQDGMLVDSFQLVQNPIANSNNFYMPEQSLSQLVGEPAEGDWKLEILDNRAGPIATNPAPNLISWELFLRTETVVPSTIPLTHAIPVSNSIPPNSISYFLVDVPAWARFATNTLFNVSGGTLNLLFNQSFLPGTVTNGGDYTLLANVAPAGTSVLQTNGPVPQLQPGQRYYLGVQNLGATLVNFSIEVDFDITTLTNMIPVTNRLAATSIPRYYQYDVSSNAVAVSFQLLNVGGNVDLVARKGAPLPDLAFNDYTSALPGTNNEDIIVVTNTLPVPLAAGRWYLGVFNNDVLPVTYTILATEYGPPIIIPLTNAVPYTNTSPPGLSLGTFYSFTITNTNSAVLFELYDMNGNVDLTLNRGVGNLPYTPPFFTGSFNLGTNREQIVERTNIIGTNINDTWYLGVPNNETTNVTYTIRAVVATNGLLVSGVPITIDVVNSTNGLTFSWPTVNGETYQVQSTIDLLNSNSWTVIATISNAPPYIDSFIDTNAPNANPFEFYRILQVPTP